MALLREIVKNIYAHRGRFTAVFVLVMATSYLLLASIGLVPEQGKSITAHAAGTEESASALSGVAELPQRIMIDTIGVDAQIITPGQTDVAVLNEALRDGVVHYPGSGKLGQKRNLFFFGHSSYLPTVHNDAYQVFNGLQDLVPGDVIRVRSENREYHYRVTDVSLVKAEEALVDFESGSRTLTLSTCNSFGAKSERYVVDAEFTKSILLTEKAEKA